MPAAMEIDRQGFASRLIAWQARHGRHDLPWQGTRDAYRIWLSEIMLQQTRVAAVLPYYRRFLERFPRLADLAAADLEQVLALWSGLGYYSRARNLHRAAQLVVLRHSGALPRDSAALAELPGIGRSTAAAIAVFAFGERRAILDGNVKRVLARVFGVEGFPGQTEVERRLWAMAEALLPERGIEAYTQGLMDLGATVCARKRPSCALCPVASLCLARATGRVAELPQPRPRRAPPLRRTAMLLVACGGEVLLERRPPAGVWAGMWCFPEMPPEENPVVWCLRKLNLAAEPVARLAPVTHGFTHFRLEIQPQVMKVVGRPAAAGEPGQLWLPPADALEAAIPAPVRSLLRKLGEAGAWFP